VTPTARRQLRRAGTAGALALLAATGGLWVTSAWVQRKAAPFLLADGRDAPHRTWAIVPGAGVHPDGTPSLTLEYRLSAALDLFRAGRVDRVLVSGRTDGDEDEVGPMARWLLDRGLPPDRLDRDPDGHRTILTMQRAALAFGVRDALVCTQDFHLARSVWLAREFGIDALGVPAKDALWPGLGMTRELFGRARAVLDRTLFRSW